MEERFKLKKVDEKRYSLDLRGVVCPYPQLLTLRALNQLDSGNILEVTLDNPPSVRDIQLALENKNYKISEVSKVSKEAWRIVTSL